MQESGNAWTDVWSAWQKMQADAYVRWMDMWLRAWGQRVGAEEGGEPGNYGTPGDLYRQWQEFMRELMDRFAAPAQGVGPETFARMFQSADVYSHLYAMWVGMYDRYRKAVGEDGELDLKALGGLLEEWADEYRELVSKIFAPALPEQLQWIAELYSGEIPLMAAGLMMRIWAPWYMYVRDVAARGMNLTRPAPETILELYEGWRKAYEESFGRLLKAPVMGYYREAAEKLVKAVDSLNEFNLVLSEFYASLQGAGSKGFERLQERLAAMQAEGKGEPMSFRDLYRLWWQTNEDIYIELFRTEEFSRLLGSLVDRAMQFRRAFQAYVEEITKELPFPNRSEMDNLYKTVDRLKREVRSLKKELAASRVSEKGE